jgi:hypothetical protein
MSFDNATIKMTKKGNLRINGKKHKAVPSDGGCSGCVLREEGDGVCDKVACTPLTRAEFGFSSGHVIFVKKEKRNETAT